MPSRARRQFLVSGTRRALACGIITTRFSGAMLRRTRRVPGTKLPCPLLALLSAAFAVRVALTMLAPLQESLLGYALDGFPIYGPLSGSKSQVDARLDECNGQVLEDGSYRYHVRTPAQVDGAAPHAPPGRASNWNYVLGCFAGSPVSSLGLREVDSPIGTASDAWIGAAAGGLADLALLTTATVAEQLGLSGRIGVCLCDPGWVGADCLMPGCPGNCTGHGTCVGNLTEARCVCDVNWGGVDCATAANTTCFNGCNGHGTCLWADYRNATCLCDAEWGGSGCEIPLAAPCDRNCSFHGSCFNKTCVCDPGWVGHDCEVEQLNLNATLCWQWISGALVNNSCSGRGSCFNGTCACDPGWIGGNCSTEVTHPIEYIDCPHNCSFHGACSFQWDSTFGTYNGTCLCDAGWAGPDCSLDWGSSQCAGNCSAHGTCLNGTCVCDPSWMGFDCNERWYPRLCPLNCSDHGTCSNGTCTCDLGWLGENCSLPLPCPNDCSGNGVCDRGNCTCDPGFAGADCSHSPYCPGFLPDVGVNCSGHGVCINGNCSCDLQWGGLDCSIQGCLNSCSKQGMCINGTCDCYAGFIGDDCSMGPYAGECPGSCSGHGACALVATVPLPTGVSDIRRDGILGGTVGCVCDEGWTGPDCTIRACPEDCNGNGACAQNGTCFCYRFWGGKACSEAACPNRCNDRGTCVGGQGCLCDVGYEGIDCGVSACPRNCSSNGVCLATPGDQYGDNLGERGYEHSINASLARCLCFYGWGGEDCSQLSCALNCSYPQGQCFNGTCVCDQSAGYFGRNCSEIFGSVELRTDGKGVSPSYGIFKGGSSVTVRGKGFVSAETMRCKFGQKTSPATIVQPTPPEMPYAICITPAVENPRTVFFQFSIDGVYFTETDSRIRFVYHGEGLITNLQWPTGPVQGGTEITFFGLNLQYAIGTRCRFGTFEVEGTYNTLFIEDESGEEQTLEGRLMCPVPSIIALNLPEEATGTVELFVSMDYGTNWMLYSQYPYFRYYGITHVSPSFGPRQDQNTIMTVYGFNLFQGLSLSNIFPGFTYDYACLFYLPWLDEPVRVQADPATWTLVTAPHTRAKFGCTVPPGLVRSGGYSGPVEVGASINPCLRLLADVDRTGVCIGELPFARDPINPVMFYYAQTGITSLSVTVGPITGGTYVTISGENFVRRDQKALPAGYEHAPVLCSWGGQEFTSQGTYANETNTVTCVSPPCDSRECKILTSEQCPNCAVPIYLEVALNGMDYSVTERQFSYFKDPNVLSIAPTLGPVLGGTRVTITSEGFHDPCQGCEAIGSCTDCGNLVRCRFQSFDIVEYSSAQCVRLADGTCDPIRIACETPYGRDLRGNLVSLDPFFVAVSVSINDQQYFPLHPETMQPYNVFDDACLPPTVTTGCAFRFKFFEVPRISSVYPTAAPGTGGGRITLTGVNFLNENTIRCQFGLKQGAPACTSGATGTFEPCLAPGCCQGAETTSAVFISSNKVICPTIDLTGPDGETPLLTRVGLTLGGSGGGLNDASFLVDTDNNVVENALTLYWAVELFPSIGFSTGGTRITVTGINFDALSPTGDNAGMRCKFGDAIISPDPTVIVDGEVQDPVDFSGGRILCTAPAVTMGGEPTRRVSVGICMIDVDCLYTGPAAQASTTEEQDRSINHFTRGLEFLHYEVPTMATLSPSLGPREGGTRIIVTGIGFFDSPLLRCRYDLGHLSEGSNVIFVSPTEVHCITPQIALGNYKMELTFNAQQYAAGCGDSGECTFKVYVDPQITALDPLGGINTGGTSVTIKVASAVDSYADIKCKFLANNLNDASRLEAEDLSLEVQAFYAAGSVGCFAPRTSKSDNEPTLHTPTPAKPDHGKTQVLISWNGQQFGPPTGTPFYYFYHDAVQVASLSPAILQTGSDGLTMTVFGENFLNIPTLHVMYGDNLFLCSPGAPQNNCPEDATHYRDAVAYVSRFEIHVAVPRSDLNRQVSVKAANNYEPAELSQTAEVLRFSSEACPSACKGKAPTGTSSHGSCMPVSGSLKCVCKNGYTGRGCTIGPEIVGIVPRETFWKGGYTVTVIGRNFAPEWATEALMYKARLGARIEVEAAMLPDLIQGYDAAVFTISSLQASTIGSGQMEVEITINGADYTVNQRSIKVAGPPTVSKVTPNGADVNGGVIVTIAGTGFIDSPELSVAFGELVSRSMVFVSSTKLVATTAPCSPLCPNGTDVFVKIFLEGKGEVSNVPFRYLNSSSIISIFPPFGSLTGGTPLAIDATNKHATNDFRCRFGEVDVYGTYDAERDRLVCNTPSVTTPHVVSVQIALDGQTFSIPTAFEYRAPISVSSARPSMGPVAGGTHVTIHGTGFYTGDGASPLCLFGTKSVPMRYVSETEMNCTAPAGEGRVTLQITLNGVDYPNQEGFTFQYYVQPDLFGTTSDTLTPMGSPIVGGTRLTITGVGFLPSDDGIRARFRDLNTGTEVISAPATLAEDGGSMVVTTPPFPIHSQNVRVSVSLNGGQQFSVEAIDVFTYYRQPDFRELIPPLGPRLGETSVVAFGSGFINIGAGIARCRFGSMTVEAVFDDSSGSGEPVLSCRSPPWPAPEWVPVEVALDGQVFTKKRTVLFQYYGEFDVNTLTPAGGPKAGGTEVTITGVGFFMSGIYLNCFFGDGTLPCSIDVQYPCYKAVQAEYYSPTRATCVAPSMPDGGVVTTPYPVRLGLNGQFGQSCPNRDTSFQCLFKASLQFTYYEDVYITRILPNSGQVMGGTRITISGRNFRTDLTSRTRCVFTSCTSRDVWISGTEVGKLKPGKIACSGTTIAAKADGVLSSTEIVCRTPLATTSDSHFAMVDVSLNSGVVYQRYYGPTCIDSTCPVMFFYYALPLIGTLSPNLGPESGLTIVTVNGVGFIGQKTNEATTGFKNTETRCRFGGIESSPATTGSVTPVRFITESSISCLAPPQPVSEVRIQISLNGLDSDFTDPIMGSLYIYYRQPKLSGVPQPSAGPTTGGTVITLTGTGFRDGDLKCRFFVDTYHNDTDAIYLSPTQLSCPVPPVPREQLVDVAVSLNGQDFSPFVLEKLFKYFPEPRVTSASPAGGPAESTGVAYVRGQGFLDTDHVKCRVGTVVSQGYYLNSSMIQCVIPQAQPKVYSQSVLSLGVVTPEILPDDYEFQSVQTQPLEVSLDGQIFSNSKIAYTYYISPEIKVIAPSSGPKTSATTVAIITGSSFRNDFGGPFCRFGGDGATRAVFLSDRNIMCAVPPVVLGKRVLVEISINGQEYESHKSVPYIFYGTRPELRAATLSATYSRVDITFDVPTDRARLAGDFGCDKVLALPASELAATLSPAELSALGPNPSTGAGLTALFGYGSFCRFVNNQTLAIVTGAQPKFTTLSNVTLKEGVIMRGNELTYFAAGFTQIMRPTQSAAPKAVLSGAQRIGRCDLLAVDGSGSTGGAGRQLNYYWTLGSGTVITDDNLTPTEKSAFLATFRTRIEGFAGAAFDASGVECRNPLCEQSDGSYADCYCTAISVVAADLPLGNFHIELRVENWLGVLSEASTFVVTKMLTAIPIVKIDAVEHDGALTFSGNKAIALSANAQSSACEGSDSEILEFSWSVADAATGAAPAFLESASTKSAVFTIPQHGLTAGRSYVITCTVNVRGSTLLVTADSVRVTVRTTAPVAIIAGGDRTHRVDLELLLDGSGSYHPDYAPSAQPALESKWACAATAVAGGAATCDGTGTGNMALLTVPANSLKPLSVSCYTFTLSVRLEEGPWVTASVQVWPQAADDNSPIVEVHGSALHLPVTPNQRFVLSSHVAGEQTDLAYQWSTYAGDKDLAQVQFLRSPNSRTPLLVVKPNVFTPGTSYTVRLTVTRGGRSGFGQVTFSVDDPPSGGYLHITPTSGSSISTVFTFAAPDWQEDSDSLPLSYQFAYTQPTDNVRKRIADYSSSFSLKSTLPAGPSIDNNAWDVSVNVRNSLGTETYVTGCNMGEGLCKIFVMPKSYTETVADITAAVGDLQAQINAGSHAAVLDSVTQLLVALSAVSGTSRRRRAMRLLLATEAERAASAETRCRTIAPFILSSLEGGVTTNTASSAASALRSLYAVPEETTDECTQVLDGSLALLLLYLAQDWSETPNAALTGDLTSVIGSALSSLKFMFDRAEIGSGLAGQRMKAVLSHLENLNALSTHGTLPGESFISLTAPNMVTNAGRISAPITSGRRRSEAEQRGQQIAQLRAHGRARREAEAEAEAEEEAARQSLGVEIEEFIDDGIASGGGARRKLLSASTTTVSSISVSFIQATIEMPSMPLPFAIPVVPCRTADNGVQECQAGTVSASIVHFTFLFNPHFYAPSSSGVIASVLSFELQAFGLQSPIVMENLTSAINFKFTLTQVPSALRDSRGHYRVAACAIWSGTEWVLDGCTTGRVDGQGSIDCTCTRTSHITAIGAGSQHTVLDVPGDCAGVPYGSLSVDGCDVCGGDNSTCRGCDNVVASGKVLDGCLVCGGDNSSCAGCDGVPNSGKVYDECGLCGGDNSTCLGCDGVAIHMAVTARTNLRPKAYDRCVSAEHPNGVCGGCDASCKGCDGVPNSGKEWDKCGLCGPYNPPGPGQYSLANKDQSCELGLLDCGSGQVADACGTCTAIATPETERNKACLGCDNVPRVFGRKAVDACGLCGGNDCSCRDCTGVVNGPAKYDKCGVCNGNNTCLDCFGVPFGPYQYDACGVCGGTNDTTQCSGCDGRVYRRPLVPPRFDVNFECCPAHLVSPGLYPEKKVGESCGDICNATIGCDLECSATPKLVDRCGVCGGTNAPATGACDCAGVPYGKSEIGCDGVCRNPPVRLDKCGVCGGTNEKGTGLCDCAGVPAGTPGSTPSLPDSAGECCYLSDMGCASPARCWSGKTLDQCGTCGGDGGTCIEVRPSAAPRTRPAPALLAALLAALLLALLHDRR